MEPTCASIAYVVFLFFFFIYEKFQIIFYTNGDKFFQQFLIVKGTESFKCDLKIVLVPLSKLLIFYHEDMKRKTKKELKNKICSYPSGHDDFTVIDKSDICWDATCSSKPGNTC